MNGFHAFQEIVRNNPAGGIRCRKPFAAINLKCFHVVAQTDFRPLSKCKEIALSLNMHLWGNYCMYFT